MSKFRIPEVEWFYLIRSSLLPCVQILQATVSKLVILSIPHEWFNIWGFEGFFKAYLSWWMTVFSSLESSTVTSWVSGSWWKTEFSEGDLRNLYSSLGPQLMYVRFEVIDSYLAKCEEWPEMWGRLNSENKISGLSHTWGSGWAKARPSASWWGRRLGIAERHSQTAV